MSHQTVGNRFLLCSSLLAILTGCGGGGIAGIDEPQAPSAPVNVAVYKDLLAYCGATEPTGATANRDGWTTQTRTISGSGGTYDGNSMVSFAGSVEQWDEPIKLSVPVTDYRGQSGSVVTSGYGKPEWRMGVAIPTVLAPKSIACVTQTARIYSTPPISIDLGPGQPTIQRPGTGPLLTWRSYWNPEVPVTLLNGYRVDGFEFVSNFEPLTGYTTFTVDKTRFSAPQELSICHLPASATQWNCVRASVTDRGEHWQLTASGVKQGVYVLVSPSLN